jgi:hypothetical protein
MSAQWSEETVETVAHAIHHPQSGRWERLTEWDQDFLRDRARVVLAVLGEEGLLVDPGAPRTWSLPPEPGPEVTEVADRFGRGWLPATGRPGWWVSRLDLRDRKWPELVAMFGPLADASTPPLTAALIGAPEGAGDAPPASPA